MSEPIPPNREFYVTGGTLPPDSPSYIERQADQELYEATLRGDFCYVLTSRQMGKSSLMARTAKRLKAQGVNTAIIDLTQIGGEQTTTMLGEWYYGILHQILRALGIKENLQAWWNDRTQVSPVQRLTECFHDLILEQTSEGIVILIDEIDSTINLPFTDDFFAAIRASYNARATEEAYQRLTFVLLGVATPSQLIKDQTRTPFNVGHRIDLTDFSWEEARPLAQGLGNDAAQSEALLHRVLDWTGGHPYLTQKLCHLLVQGNGQASTLEDVDHLVKRHFLSTESNKEEYNLKFVRDRLTGESDRTRDLLLLYRHILNGKTIIDNTLSPIHSTLKLSGIVVPVTNGTLKVRNNIYRQVFDEAWIQAALPRDRMKWAIASTAAACIFGFILLLYLYFLTQPYIQQLQTAKEDVPTEAYEWLKAIPGYSGKADELLAEYWDLWAVRSATEGNRDKAILARLQALSLQDLPQRRKEITLLIGKDYEKLQATFRHLGPIHQASFSPDGQYVVTGSDDQTAVVWRTNGTGIPIVLKGHTDAVTQTAFSPDGQYVVTGSADGTARVWRADGTGKPQVREECTNGMGQVAFSPDGQFILTYVFASYIARVWPANGVGEPIILRTPKIFKDSLDKPLITRLDWSPDGKRIVAGTLLFNILMWDLANLEKPPLDLGKEENGWFQQPHFSPNGMKILSHSSLKDWLGILRADGTGDPVVFKGHKGKIWRSTFSSDGQWVVTGSADKTARVWRADGTGDPVVLIGHTGAVTQAAFSGDGQWVVTGSADKTARVWRADGTGDPVVLIGHTGAVTQAAFSRDGQWVLTAAMDGTAKVWRWSGPGEPLILEGHKNSVNRGIFSPDGQSITDAPPVKGGSSDLLEAWKQKLALEFDVDGKIIPRRPVGEPIPTR